MDPIILDLTQISEIKRQEPKRVSERSAQGTVTFEDLLSSSMKKVNELQLESDEMVRRLATGDVDDISEVVLASSRAEVALKMFMELRNKFLDAYQQLSRISA